MTYRPLGDTGLSLSAIGLGGHFKTPDGGRYWDTFPNDKVPPDVLRNRIEVVSACLDAGINYIDITTAAECMAYGAALQGCRDRFVIGADDYQWGPRNLSNCTVDGLTANVEQCLRRLCTDYLDIWRVTTDMQGGNTDEHIAAVIETADRLRCTGKIRHLGLSSHHPAWLHRVIETFPEIEIAIFPCTGLTTATKSNEQQSLFDLITQRHLGLITIKPFAGGNLFNADAPPCDRQIEPSDSDDLARLTLQSILTKHPAISSVIPGLTTVSEAQQAVLAANTLDVSISLTQRHWIEQQTKSRLARLPACYQWLRDWDCI